MDQLKERINRLIQIAFDADPEPDDKRRAAETIGALMDALLVTLRSIDDPYERKRAALSFATTFVPRSRSKPPMTLSPASS
jgi:hypothetical protein